MLFSRYQPSYLARHRELVINTRMRFFAAIFALLLLCWIPIDFLFLPVAVATDIALLRIFTSVLFILLVLSVTEQSRWHHARLRLVLMMFSPLAFYLAVQLLFTGIEVGSGGIALIDIYNLLPFIVVSGLAVFPLTVLESLGVGLASLIAMAIAPQLSSHFQTVNFIPAAWILLLIIGISTMAAAIQLNYMSSLIHRVSIDPLTGAFTRQSGQELLDLHFQLSAEQDTPFAVAFFDLDKFKSINDNYGHEAGDEVLKGAVENLQRLLRRGDMVVRWGGEEFLVLLLDADHSGIEQVMARITTEWLGKRPDGMALTASIGVAERTADGLSGWEEMVELADKRMYHAKLGGRARVIAADMSGD